jgi:predicted lysophospholipase L1 biosynthesis ABC-type transport system permease subunit
MSPLRDKLQAMATAFDVERLKGYPAMSQKERESFLNQQLLIEPAASGVSEMQKGYGRALAALGVLVALVLLIACTNLASLMTAHAGVRAREMALRVSIGAGRWRLARMVLIENALLAGMASGLGALLSWQAAPFVVGMVNPADDPVRLMLPADWRVLGFGLALTIAVTLLFGLSPALRASAIRPVEALKGGAGATEPRAVDWRVAIQVAFCFLVLYTTGLFVTTFQRLSDKPMGFSAEGVLLLDTVTKRPQPAVYWDQTMEHLRGVPGVESVGLAGFR